MTRSIFADAQAKPHLFLWNKSIETQRLLDWANQHGWIIPFDLLDIWSQTGGGDIFESETLLRPVVDDRDDESVEHRTRWYRARGLPAGMFVFHEGMGVSAIRRERPGYVWFDMQERLAASYGSFDEWYVQLIRLEYAERYGLSAI